MSKELTGGPKIITELPGPKAKKLIEKDVKYTSSSYTRGYPLVAENAKGCLMEDIDGNVFLDFTAGIAVTSTGHCHPEVVEVIKDQADKLLHMSGTDFYYSPQADLSEKLAQIAPGDSPKSVFLCNSGTEAVEAAIKLARYKTGRRKMIAFLGAFHGRTMGALSLTASKAIQRERFSPLLPEVIHIPYANCYRCHYNLEYPSCELHCAKILEDVYFAKNTPPSSVAAIFVEPLQGEGGYIWPPKEFMVYMRELCTRHGIMLVCDEVQAGMGRTGKMFASEHFGIEPDIITLAKGLASGMPLGAMVAKKEVMDWPPGAHASTFGGNPVCCRAALKTIELLEREIIDNVNKVGDFLMTKLNELKERSKTIGDVRGKGLMIGIEFVLDKAKKKRAPEIVNEIVDKAFYKGLLLLGCGESAIRFCPPLVLTIEQAETAMKIFEECVAEVEKEMK